MEVAEKNLKRFLYTSSEDPKYIVGDPEANDYYCADKVKSINELLQLGNSEILCNIIEIINSENLVPRRESLFFVLAMAAHSEVELSHDSKHRIYVTLANIIKTTEELFTFIKFYTKRRKSFTSALNKVIALHYLKKDPMDLAREVTICNGYHSWKHKDLFKLAHCKTEDILITIVLKYVLHGLKEGKEIAEGKPEAKELVEYLSKVDDFKRCEDEQKIAALIPQLHFTLRQVLSYYHKSKLVWEALIPELPLKELIAHLPRLYKLGFLKSNTSFQTKVIEALTDAEKIKSSRIHPVEVFINLRNFEKGGKPMDPHLQKHLEDLGTLKDALERVDTPKCPSVMRALYEAMHISFQNPPSTGRRYLITIDVSDKMDDKCLHNKNLTCLDAATIMMLSILRTEKDVTVAVFNDSRINIVSLGKNIAFNQAIVKLKQMKKGYVLPSSPIKWAVINKKPVDVFINFLYYHHWFLLIPKELRDKEKPLKSLEKYRKKMFLPHSKLISFSLSTAFLEIADQHSKNVLDICGFDKHVPNIVEAFSRGLFC